MMTHSIQRLENTNNHTRVKDVSQQLRNLLKRAQSKDEMERYQAVIEIADLAERESIQPLMAMANDSSEDVRLVVASTLGFLGERHKDNTPVPALVDMFKQAGENDFLKKQIIESLGMIGDPSVGWLVESELDKAERDPDLLQAVINAIGKIKDKKVAGKVLKYLQHDEESVRLATATALGEVGDTSFLDALFKAADDVSSEVAGNALISIGKIGDKSALERLFSMLEQEPKLPSVLEQAVRDAIDMIK